MKGLMQPLAEKIGVLTELVQEMIDNLKEQTETQKEILVELKNLNEKKCVARKNTP